MPRAQRCGAMAHERNLLESEKCEGRSGAGCQRHLKIGEPNQKNWGIFFDFVRFPQNRATP